MAVYSQKSLFIPILIAFPLLLMISSSEGASCGIGVYWGQYGTEGTLRQTCAAPNNYSYVAIAFLTTFGSGREPVLDLSGHCNPAAGTCTGLSTEIQFCQNKGIKVLLSLGGGSGNYNLSSSEDATEVAYYLWNAFLGGTDYPVSSRPLGAAPLDGVDFAIETPDNNKYWDDLARALSAYRTQRNVYLSAAPQCPYGQYSNLDAAIKTELFDYVWVEFYNNSPCDIRGGVPNLLRVWKQWNSSLSATAPTQFFLGLPASSDPAIQGFIDSGVLVNQILPQIRTGSNYGGVMLWDRHHDLLSGYSLTIRPAVCPSSTTHLNREPSFINLPSCSNNI